MNETNDLSFGPYNSSLLRLCVDSQNAKSAEALNESHQNAVVESLGSLADHIRLSIEEITTQKARFLPSFSRQSMTDIRRDYVPTTPAGVASIKASSQDATVILDSVRHFTAEAIHACKELEAEAQSAFECAQTLLSPVRKLPPVILKKIFHFYISSERPSDASDTDHADYGLYIIGSKKRPRITCPAMFLSWICWRWRRLLLSDPTFWSSLYLSCSKNLPLSVANLCHEHLSRAGNTPLTLYIDDCISENGKRVKEPPQSIEKRTFTDIILTRTENWSYVFLNADPLWFSYAARKLALQQNLIPLPNLKCLALEFKKFDVASHPDNSPIDAFLSSPGLKTFTANKLDWDTFQRFDFSQLTKLHIGIIGGNHIALFLSNLPALRSLTLDNVAQMDEVRTLPETEVVHRTLSSLRLSTGSCYPQFWRGLRLPTLNTFHFVSSDRGRDSGLLDISAVLLQSGCVLQDVTIEDIDSSQIGQFLMQHPSISRLTVSFTSANFLSRFHDLLAVLRGDQSGSNGERHEPVALAVQCLTISLSPFNFFPDPVREHPHHGKCSIG
ncbi:hypothetical protein GYMLUDRAFT_994761 [Collybiopsis luxurians FD-317 M1]|nr:hypothetical protein GYMLUDRAFT_994761 [Collybiopsis luxurians FD-317 M1]